MIVYLVAVLRLLGATRINVHFVEDSDPTNEEEFLGIDYECNRNITWQEYCEAVEIYKKETFLKELRDRRNLLLTQTDWIMTVDSYETLQNKDEWKQYRQQLRDLPSKNIPIVFDNSTPVIDNSIFPMKPVIQRL